MTVITVPLACSQDSPASVPMSGSCTIFIWNFMEMAYEATRFVQRPPCAVVAFSITARASSCGELTEPSAKEEGSTGVQRE